MKRFTVLENTVNINVCLCSGVNKATLAVMYRGLGTVAHGANWNKSTDIQLYSRGSITLLTSISKCTENTER